MLALAELEVVVLTAPSSTSSRTVVQDPDGRAVELHEVRCAE